ncbi:MAG: alanine--tRNA ligase [Patescibacteria group bacterium]
MSSNFLTLTNLRNLYLDFFVKKGHVIVPSASLVPENDPSTLFTSAGMQAMTPYFLGEKHPQGQKIANFQRCFRSEDIDRVGDNSHTTFFEMLGNWSFGDYFKKEQIEFFFEFLVDVLNLDPSHLYVSVFAGNKDLNIPRDEESAHLWQDLFQRKGVEAKIIDNPRQGLQGGRIFFYDEEKNWWSRSGVPAFMPVGELGGPDSEVFYDFAAIDGVQHFHQQSAFADQACHINCDCGRFLEIGNSVFMQYQRTQDGFKELAQKNIDFGGGLERLLTVVEGQSDVFQSSAFTGIIEKLVELSQKDYKEAQLQPAFRIIADHIRASVMLIADGVLPSNKEQGYLLRRLIRRSLRQAKHLNLEKEFLLDIVPEVIKLYQDLYPQLKAKEKHIDDVLKNEEQKFNRTLRRGLKEFNRLIVNKDQLTADLAFKLYESYGFPFELSIEEAKTRGIAIEEQIENKIAEANQQHAVLSRQSATEKFKGGLADHKDRTTAFHTATHLLQAALRRVLGDQVQQKGSNINVERLRFDFSYDQALSSEELAKIEQLLNQWLKNDLLVSSEILSKKEAIESGAIAFFADRYPDEVKVYTIGDPEDWVSKELCGGPHVEHTTQIARFGNLEIFKEKAVAEGVRRIYIRFKAI